MMPIGACRGPRGADPAKLDAANFLVLRYCRRNGSARKKQATVA